MADSATPPTQRRITSSRSRANMIYLPPDLDVPSLIAENGNFKPVQSIDARTIGHALSWKELQETIDAYVEGEGIPLVITNWHLRPDWPGHLFNPEWLTMNHGIDHVEARDMRGHVNIKMTMGHYIRLLPDIVERYTPSEYGGSNKRVYAKDVDCPPVWRDKLSQMLPPGTLYLSTEADLMSSLPPPARAENMMIYAGHEGTYTPAHKEMCASLGQNIMVAASTEGQYPGSSVWFLTRSRDRAEITEYWLSRMGHDVETESHFASIDDLASAPFPVFIHEQKVGDYILVPSMAPHQVWNRGTCTIKAAWNRLTVRSLELAMSESLAKSRLVCRDEQYKIRAIVYDTLKKYDDYLTGLTETSISQDRLVDEFVRLFKLFNSIMLEECFKPGLSVPSVEKIQNEYNVTCSFCRGNIWNRFLTCKKCIGYSDDPEDNYDICLDCYARGRSCFCISDLNWVEQHNWKTLEKHHEDFRQLVIKLQGTVSEGSPLALWEGLKKLGRKSLAWVCQEELKKRPFADISKNGLEEEETEENLVEHKKLDGRLPNCHVCKSRHESWKGAVCSTCNKFYCYGSLWRAFDLDPFDHLLSQFEWKCPVCLGICSCGLCRRAGRTIPYEPKGTYLGVSTKHVADPRSMESLVDFAKGNLVWLKTVQKRKHEEHEKDADGVPIDPSLEDPPENQGFTAVNNGSEYNHPSQGRSPPTATANVMDSSNTFGLVQAPRNTGTTGQMMMGVEVSPEKLPLNAESNEEEHHLEVNRFFFSASSNNEAFSESGPTWGDGGRHQSGGVGSQFAHSNAGFASLQTPLTALEENPLAFIAAAGLMQLPGGGGSVPMPEWPNGPPTTAAPHELYKQRPSTPAPRTQPRSLSPDELDKTPPPRPIPRRPREPQMQSNQQRTTSIGASSQTGADWISKTKVARRLAQNLSKKKRLVITLQMPKERYRALMRQIWDNEPIASDLVCLDGEWVMVQAARNLTYPTDEERRRQHQSSSAAPSAKRGRGRPRKEVVDVFSDSSDVEILTASQARNKQRRSEAFLRRKKEEDEAKAEFLAKQGECDRESATVPARNRVRHKEIFDVLKNQASMESERLPSETEEERIAREDREEEERVAHEARKEQERLALEARKEEARLARLVAYEAARLRRAEAKVERKRLRATAKTERKTLRKIQRQEEKELRRKESIRQAKLAAAGIMDYADVEEYISTSSTSYSSSSSGEDNINSDEDDEPLPEELQLLIPDEESCAVIITPPLHQVGDWRDAYEKFPEITASPPPSPPELKRARGRPRKTSGTGVPPAKPRTKSGVLLADKAFKPERHVRRSLPAITPAPERERRKSALCAKARLSQLEDEFDVDQELEDQKPIIPEKKKKKFKRVQIKPGKWAEVEITEDEDEGEMMEDEDVPDLGSPPAPEPEPMDLDMEGGGAIKAEADDEIEEDLSKEYEKRWSRRRIR